jgi:hypothetical protein
MSAAGGSTNRRPTAKVTAMPAAEARADGSRIVASDTSPAATEASAPNQLKSGGFDGSVSPFSVGNSHSPRWTMCCTTSD